MLAVWAHPGGAVALRELPDPTAPPGGVVVRVRACGLCGSDVEKLDQGAVVGVLGHEIAGEVVSGVLAAGTRVAVAHHVPCGDCDQCRAGHEPLCAAFAASALDPGGFCQLTSASAGHVAQAVLTLPDEVSDLAGSFVEPLACVLRGVEALPDDGACLIVGAGSVGLLAAAVLTAQGRELRILDSDPSRQAGHPAPQPHERFSGAFCTVAAGVPAALERLADAGTLVVFAGGRAQTVDIDTLYRRELRLEGVRSATPRHLRAALSLLASRAIDVERLVDVVLPLGDFAEGLRRYRAREARKVVFVP